MHGVKGVKFYAGTKVVTTRWPNQDVTARPRVGDIPAPDLNMPALG